MPSVENDLRDTLQTEFRWAIMEKMGITPFPHQAEWMLASDGLLLLPEEVDDSQPGRAVKLQDGSIRRWRTAPRAAGRARVLADLGAFKVGKSFGAGLWVAGFGAIPNGRVSLVGLEYDICEPEFHYAVEALCSDRGLGLKYESLQDRARDGKMWLELPNGFRLDARSWERKDTLKGKEVDAYVFCEAFMLPDLSCYTGVKQNLSARRGYALFPTTPDRPWVQELHDKGHNDPDYPDWHCTCSVPRSVNCYTHDAKEMKQAEGLMTAEKFAIAYLGRLGDYVGRVYNFQRNDPALTFDTGSHPFLWRDPSRGATLENLRLPAGWAVEAAADTGTHMGALIVAFDPAGDAFVLWEGPNYDYRSHQIELDEASSIPQWAGRLRREMSRFGVRAVWADRNSQYKAELRLNHQIALLPATANLQTRTEIAREYMKAKRVRLAPWLRILPFELENAQWPEEATAAGRFERLKVHDHVLDCFEHILARRPLGSVPRPLRPLTWAESVGLKRKSRPGNPHLGRS